MLQIKHKYHLDFPHITRSGAPVDFTGVVDDDDELTQAILNDSVTNDDNWELVERPEESALEEFWSRVQHDITGDPEWARFRE